MARLPGNGEIAQELRILAAYLAFEGQSIYRVLAHQKAAREFGQLTDSVALATLEGRLTQLPGVGPAIEAKVREYVETGRISQLEKLPSSYPEGVLEVAELNGAGPKTARRLWDELQIDSLLGVKTAAEAGRLRTLKGTGAKSEAKLLASAESALARGPAPAPRRLLGHVEDPARRLLEALLDHPAVMRAEVAGSFRRRRSTVRDSDLVASTNEPETVGRFFGTLPLVARMEQSGMTKVLVHTHNDLDVDLRLAPPASYGNLLQHATGSAQHNVELRGFSQKRGMRVNEYNVEEFQTGKAYPCAEQAAVYELLGLSWIPPELREGRGEIRAALEGTLPRLVSRKDLRGDLHVHSDWSDGRQTIEEMALTARDRGLEYICISDHSKSIGMGIGVADDDLRRQSEEIRLLNARLEGIELLAGSEVDILADGQIDLPDDLLASLDFVVASIHSGFQQPVERIMARFRSALENPFVDAIGHPSGRLLGRREGYALDIEELAGTAAATGTMLEINASYDRLDLRAAHARRAKELGALVVISSDAHSPRGFDLLPYGVGEARRGWLEAKNVANTVPLEAFRALLSRSHR